MVRYSEDDEFEYGNQTDPAEEERRRREQEQAQQTQQQPQTQPAAQPPAWNREQFRDEWMGTGSDKAAQDAILSRYGLGLDEAGRTRLPSGETMDLRIGAKAGGTQAGWTGVAGGETKTGQAPGSGSGGGGGGSLASQWNNTSSVASTPPTMPPAPAPDPMRQKLIDQLVQRSQQSLNVGVDDPTIRAQSDPFAAEQERSRRNYLADLAERSGPNANLRGEERLASERAGQAVGGFKAELIGREINARRQEIKEALAGMQGLLTAEEQMALQRELGYLDDATKRFGISTGDATQRYGIDTGADVARSGQGIDWQKALLSNDQFNASLGLQAEDKYNYWDAVNKGLID